MMIRTVTFPPLSELPNIGPPQTSPVNLELGPGRWSSFSYIMFFVLKTLICSALFSASDRICFHIESIAARNTHPAPALSLPTLSSPTGKSTYSQDKNNMI